MKHVERRRMIDEMARDIARYFQDPECNRKAIRKACFRKLYSMGLSSSAVSSWWAAIEARAIDIHNKTAPAMMQL